MASKRGLNNVCSVKANDFASDIIQKDLLKNVSERVFFRLWEKLKGIGVILALTTWVGVSGVTGCVGMGGEVINIEHEPLPTSERKYSESLLMKDKAEDLRPGDRRIGHATWSLFAAESGSVTAQRPITEEIVEEVKEALESNGFRVDLVNPEKVSSENSNHIVVTIKNFYFKNYNWLWPYVPTWGEVELGLQVKTPEGNTLYDKSFKSEGSSHQLSGEEAFSAASNEALTSVLKQMRQECSNVEFRNFFKGNTT